MLLLKVKYEDGFVKRHKFYQERQITIGRLKNNHIVIDDPTVSGTHARIDMVRDGQFIVRDLESSNGIFINGKKKGTHKLKDQDVIGIGKCKISYIYEDNVDQELSLFKAESKKAEPQKNKAEPQKAEPKKNKAKSKKKAGKK